MIVVPAVDSPSSRIIQPKRITRRQWVVVIFAVAIGLALSIYPGSAAAATYTSRPCDDFTSGASDWLATYWSSPGWQLVDECPFRLKFGADGPIGESVPFVRSFPADSSVDLLIESVRLEMRGSDGSDTGKIQGIRVCGPAECGPVVSVSGPNVTEFEQIAFPGAGGELPSGANRVELIGQCVSTDGCTNDAGLELRDIAVVFTDDVPPVVAIAPYEPSFERPNPIIPDSWNNGGRDLIFDTWDLGSGLWHAEIKRGYPWDDLYFGCGDWPVSTTQRCPRVVDQISHRVLMSQLPQGLNSLVVTAWDAAGNASDPASLSFKSDVFAPTPTDLSAVGVNQFGWVSDQLIDLRWVNAGENAETATKSGVVSAIYDVAPTVSGQQNPGHRTVTGEAINAIDNIELPDDGNWLVTISTRDRAGNSSAKLELKLKLDRDRVGAPTLTALPWIGQTAVNEGVPLRWSRPADADSIVSGICGYAIAVNDIADGDPGSGIDVNGDVTSATLPSGVTDGRHYVHLAAVSCAGVAGVAARVEIDVDLTPPVTSITGLAAGQWLDLSATVTLGANDDRSGVARVSYAVDGGPEHVFSRQSVELPVSEGVHLIAYRAQDFAGNWSGPQSVTIRRDDHAPVGAIEPQDPARPTEVRARVTDSISGVAMAWLEYRRVGAPADAPWEQFGTSAQPVPGAKGLTFVARFPETQLEPGRYQLRVVVYDDAGNVATIGVRVDGSSAELATPLRPAAIVTAKLQALVSRKRCTKTTRSCERQTTSTVAPADRVTVRFGSRVRLNGRITDSGGEPLGGAEVHIAAGNVRQPVTSRKADASGHYALTLPAGSSRRVIVRFAGSEMLAPAEADAMIFTKAKVSLAVSSPNVRAGDSVAFRGRIFGDDGVFPRLGKSLIIEYRAGRSWRPLQTTQVTRPGRFKEIFRFKRVARRLVFEFRAHVPRADGWPFEDGVSPPVKVVVKP